VTRVEKRLMWAIAIVTAATLGAGWRLFAFLTDDAYIAFRYVSNSRLGLGYVWNPPPFRPVEGYTSFLWVVLLDVVWRLTGVSPPASANVVSLLCALGSLALVLWMAWQIRLPERLQRVRPLLVGLVGLGVVTNRTFATWTSSGFETALFDFLVLLWVRFALLPARTVGRQVLGHASATALLCLARPDGLLFAAASLILLSRTLRRAGGERPRLLAACSPLLLVVLHLVWRRVTYGAWLPNPYHAKVVAPWPASGARYAASFILEYAVWVGLALGAVAAVRAWRLTRALAPGERWPWGRTLERHVVPLLVAGTLAAHAAFYTFVVGGDHFEYRVYCHLVPLGWLACLWLVARARLGARAAVAFLVASLLLAVPVPWTHWALTHERQERLSTRKMFVPIAPHWPVPVRWYARAFDRLQASLILHAVCARHQEHKVNEQFLRAHLPTREQGEQVGPEGLPVLAFPAVGVVSWVLPHVCIIDLFGLNDWVIARSRPEPSGRWMAHDRQAPAAYVECFAPNVDLEADGRVEVKPRETPLTPAQVEACERRWAAIVRGHGGLP